MLEGIAMKHRLGTATRVRRTNKADLVNLILGGRQRQRRTFR